jgi:dethiobiotin synthetase
MTQTYFITGTDTGVGKTVFTALLAEYLRRRGVRVAALKPVCSGGRGDAEILGRALGGALALDRINPWHFRAPIAPLLAARREGRVVRLPAVLAHIRTVQKEFETVLVEGAGGLLSPLGSGFDSRDLLLALTARPVIVAANRLGVVNQILLTLEALPKGFRADTKVVLMAPSQPDLATRLNVALLKYLSIPGLCQLPWLGAKFSIEAALRRPQTRRTLDDVLGGRNRLVWT